MNKKLKITILCILICLLMFAFIASHGSKLEYTLYFNSNGGNPCQPIKIKGKHGIVLPIPQRDGYTFEGWYFDNNKWMNKLTPTTFSNKRPKSDMTVYAKWIFSGYIVSFETNGGSQVQNITVDKGGVISSQPFTERQGYTFLGWCVDSSLMIFYEFGTPINSSMTLYAKWVAKDDKQHCTITFQVNGGDAIAPVQVLEGTGFNPPNPVRMGYDFLGWYLDEALTMLYPSGGVITTDITLYASWEHNPDMFKVTFNSDGGSEIEPVWVMKGQKIQKPIPEKDGFDFVNWYVDIQKTQIFNFENGIYNNLILYAKWEEDIPFTVYYMVYYYSDGELIAQNQLEENSVIPNRTEQKEGFIFQGWYADSDLTVPFNFNTLINQDTSLFAKWKEKSEYYENGFNFEISPEQDYFIITAYNGTQKNVIIPETYNNKPVKKIDEYVFSGTLVSDMQFSNNLTEIGISAFENCNSLTSIRIPMNIELIADRAFSNCDNLTSVIIEGNLELGRYIFENCAKIATVNLSNSITRISDYMFYNCTGLQSITLPENCQEIGISAFEKCRSLSTVNINHNLVTIRNQAFYDCISLSQIDLKNTITIRDKVFSFSGLTTVTLPDSVESLGDNAFGDCVRLKTVEIGCGLASMENSFMHSYNITKFIVSNQNLTYSNVGNNLFSKDQTELIIYASGQPNEEYFIPEGTTTVDVLAFSYVNALTKIIFPSTVVSVSEYAFMNLPNLAEFEVNSDNQHYSSENGVLFNKDKTQLIKYPFNKPDLEFTMPQSVNYMQPSAFMGATNLERITLSKNITAIPAYAFYQTRKLKDVDFNNAAITAIGDYAFYGCVELSMSNQNLFQLPQGLKSIGNYAFANTGLTEITIINSVTQLGRSVFETCVNLQKASINASENLRIENSLFNNCVSLQRVEIFKAPVFIGNAFGNCNAIAIVIIRDNTNFPIIEANALGMKPVLEVDSAMYELYVKEYSQFFTVINKLD